MIVITVIILASPSFTPGTGEGIGIHDSTIDKNQSLRNKQPQQNSLFYSVHIYTS